MIWNSVAERANSTFPVKFLEKETGFAIMESRSIMRWKSSIQIRAMIGGDGINDSALFI